jgi:hypothetical protein
VKLEATGKRFPSTDRESAAITLFTWGYSGWGNATRQLVEAVDSVERGRGFAPPLFVDIRIRRNVRAKGFNGPAFEKLLGPDRHRWLKSLGNKHIETRTGPPIQIADPPAAVTLLELGRKGAEEHHRVLFFCSCRFPRAEGKTACHRDTVADLVLQATAARKLPLEVVEWPGGQPKQLDLEVPSEVFKALQRGRGTIPWGNSPLLATYAGLPWGSVVTVRCGNQARRVVSGPATCQRSEWVLPVFSLLKADTPLAEIEAEARKLRQGWGLEGRSSCPATGTGLPRAAETNFPKLLAHR